MQQAEKAVQLLQQSVDTLIVVSNDKLLQIVPDNAPLQEAFLVADDVLRQGTLEPLLLADAPAISQTFCHLPRSPNSSHSLQKSPVT